jgi:hypothetical protein
LSAHSSPAACTTPQFNQHSEVYILKKCLPPRPFENAQWEINMKQREIGKLKRKYQTSKERMINDRVKYTLKDRRPKGK